MSSQERFDSLLKDYSRAIVHMRAQIELERFGLIFGAGISKDFGFPSWNELIERIACDDRVNGEQFCGGYDSKTSISQLLFQSFRSKQFSAVGDKFSEYDKFSAYIQSGWSKIVRDALYKDVPADVQELKQKGSYLLEYLEIIKKLKLTVNYNFDDTIQNLLAESRSEEEKSEQRGYRTVWNSDVQLYPQTGVIYHPNGFLPHDISNRPSDDLIFLEDSFGDQLIESTSGHYSTLSYHLAQNTCLFIGLSLEDSTLKHLLRKNSTLHPGHVHYYVHYLNNVDAIDVTHKSAISDANFEVYNLKTLFLDKNGLSDLAKILKCPSNIFGLHCESAGKSTSYKFFLTGGVSVGKSTTVSHFRSLQTHDEWLEQRASGMEKDPSIVSDKSKIEKIDQWVVDQWRLKNYNLLNKANHGVHIIDRCPLDAFAFTPEDEWVKKAIFTRKGIIPKKSQIKLVEDKIILMIGDPEIMSVRALKLQKKFSAEKLNDMQRLLKIIYSKTAKGIVELDTRDKTVNQVVKEICRIIHMDEYEECDIQGRLDAIEKEEITPKQST